MKSTKKPAQAARPAINPVRSSATPMATKQPAKPAAKAAQRKK